MGTFRTCPELIPSYGIVEVLPERTFEVDRFGERGITFFSQLTACMSDKTPSASAKFGSHINIIKMKVYNDWLHPRAGRYITALPELVLLSERTR
jgi:hypothetical protein